MVNQHHLTSSLRKKETIKLRGSLPGRLSDTVASRMLSPTALTNEGPPVTAPSFWLVTRTTIPLLSPCSRLGYHFSKTWSAYSKASALLWKQTMSNSKQLVLGLSISYFGSQIQTNYVWHLLLEKRLIWQIDIININNV